MAGTLREKIEAHIQMLEQENLRVDFEIEKLESERVTKRNEIARLRILLRESEGESND